MKWLVIFLLLITCTSTAGREETMLKSFMSPKLSIFLIPLRHSPALSLSIKQAKLDTISLKLRPRIPLQMIPVVSTSYDSKNLLKAFAPSLLRIIPTRAVYFCAYTATKEKLKPVLGDSQINHRVRSFAAGIFSEAVCFKIIQIHPCSLQQCYSDKKSHLDEQSSI